MEKKNHIGNYIRLKRKEAKVSQRQIAQEIGVSPQFISSIEAGTRTPPEWFLAEVSRVLKLDGNEMIITLLADYQLRLENIILRKQSVQKRAKKQTSSLKR